MAQKKDLTGKKFGKLTVIRFDHKSDSEQYYWLCKCDCGNEHIANRSGLVRGNIQSCGCLMGSPKHRLSGSRFDKTYWNMKYRCESPKHSSYDNYGSRGIKCQWKSVQEFADDMLESYNNHVDKHGEKQTQIDRIDNNGHYCKENCKWSTRSEQCLNRRPKRKLKEIYV